MSVRASSLISIPCWDSFSEWVRRFFVRYLIHDIVRSSPSCSVREEACSCHVHLRPHGQLILASVSGLLVLYFPFIFLIPFMPCLKISFLGHSDRDIHKTWNYSDRDINKSRTTQTGIYTRLSLQNRSGPAGKGTTESTHHRMAPWGSGT